MYEWILLESFYISKILLKNTEESKKQKKAGFKVSSTSD